MRVLVTGHDGYIGTVLVPLLAERGPRGRRPRQRPVRRAARFGPPSAEPCPRSAMRHPRRRARATSRASTPSSTSPALSNDPLGDLNPRLTYDINHRGLGPPGRGWPRQAGVARFLFSSSCSLYGAAGDDCLDETADVQPGHALRRVARCWPSSDLAALADDDFSPTYLRNATAYGVSPRLRGDLVVNNLVGYAVTTGEVLHEERRHAVAAARAHRGHRRARSSPCSRRRATLVHDEAFNVGAHRGELPDPRGRRDRRARSCPAAAITLRRRRRPRHAQLPRRLRQDRPRRCPAFQPQWTVRARRRAALRGLPAATA